jgi:ribosome-associated toxin RatA of RatAB toxin-antitoxin module
VPGYSDSATETIPAPIETVWAALLDYERIPEWQKAVREARVVERDDSGRGVVVAYTIDVRVSTVHYTLRHHYDEPTAIRSTYVEGDFRDCHGEWTFTDRGDGTTDACFALAIDPGRAIPGPVRRMMSQRVMKGSVADLKRHFSA